MRKESTTTTKRPNDWAHCKQHQPGHILGQP